MSTPGTLTRAWSETPKRRVQGVYKGCSPDAQGKTPCASGVRPVSTPCIQRAWRRPATRLRLKGATVEASASAFEDELMDEARRLLAKQGKWTNRRERANARRAAATTGDGDGTEEDTPPSRGRFGEAGPHARQNCTGNETRWK